jgi:hypothetical protein
MVLDLDTMSGWLAAPARHVAEAPAEPDAHDITMKNRQRGAVGSHRALVVNHACERLAHSTGQGQHRCERNDARGPTGDRLQCVARVLVG